MSLFDVVLISLKPSNLNPQPILNPNGLDSGLTSTLGLGAENAFTVLSSSTAHDSPTLLAPVEA